MPFIGDVPNSRAADEEDKSFDDVIQWYSRLHCLVVGPGLGREERMMQLVKVIQPVRATV